MSYVFVCGFASGLPGLAANLSKKVLFALFSYVLFQFEMLRHILMGRLPPPQQFVLERERRRKGY